VPHDVFISYRRSDTAWAAQLIALHLDMALGDRGVRIFIDTEDLLPLGAPYDAYIDRHVRIARAVLVLIGSRWLDEENRKRLEDPKDFVRREIEVGLAGGRRVIPILIGDADLPPADLLPESIRHLCRMQAVRLPGSAFPEEMLQDVSALAARLSEHLELPPADASSAIPTLARRIPGLMRRRVASAIERARKGMPVPEEVSGFAARLPESLTPEQALALKHFYFSLPRPGATRSQDTIDAYIRATSYLLSWLDAVWHTDLRAKEDAARKGASPSEVGKSIGPAPSQAELSVPNPSANATGEPAGSRKRSSYWLKVDPDGPEPPDFLGAGARRGFLADRAFRAWLKDPLPPADRPVPSTGMPEADEELRMLIEISLKKRRGD
jgi:hypothetical protein